MKEKKKRKPYKRGAKSFLASMEVLETKVIPSTLAPRGIASCASMLKAEVGMQFAQTKRGGINYVTRLHDVSDGNEV